MNSVQVTDATHLKVDLSVAANAAIGARALTVKNTDGGSATLNAAFTVGALPTVSSISPNSVRQGQTLSVAINGTNFLTNFGTGGGSVSFGTGITVNSVTRNSATKLTANITAGDQRHRGGHTVTVVELGRRHGDVCELPDGRRAAAGHEPDAGVAPGGRVARRR